FGVVDWHRGGDDDMHVGWHVVGVVAEVGGDALGAEPLKDRALAHIGTADLPAAGGQELGEWGHSGATDGDEVGAWGHRCAASATTAANRLAPSRMPAAAARSAIVASTAGSSSSGRRPASRAVALTAASPMVRPPPAAALSVGWRRRST